MNAYIKGEEHLSESACPAEREREEERVMLALRTARGLDLSALREDTRDAGQCSKSARATDFLKRKTAAGG